MIKHTSIYYMASPQMNYLERHKAYVLPQRKIKERAERGSVKKKCHIRHIAVRGFRPDNELCSAAGPQKMSLREDLFQVQEGWKKRKERKEGMSPSQDKSVDSPQPTK